MTKGITFVISELKQSLVQCSAFIHGIKDYSQLLFLKQYPPRPQNIPC